MVMLSKIGRLFQIKTRLETWMVIYAIALGAVERGRHYLDAYPGWGGWLLALACTGVVFIAGGKLLDWCGLRPPHSLPARTVRPFSAAALIVTGRRASPAAGHRGRGSPATTTELKPLRRKEKCA